MKHRSDEEILAYLKTVHPGVVEIREGWAYESFSAIEMRTPAGWILAGFREYIELNMSDVEKRWQLSRATMAPD